MSSSENIFHKIALSPAIAEIWLGVLSDIALDVRLQQGGRIVVDISREETAYLDANGSLILAVFIDGQQVTMSVPAQFWWHKGEKI
jgi:hypothetical protein